MKLRCTRWLLTVALLAGVTALPGCPDEEVPEAPSVAVEVERHGYPNVYPTAPLERVANPIPAWTSGHALAVLDDRVLVADQGNRRLVVLDRATLEIADTIELGGAPEQLVAHDSGAVWLSLRGDEQAGGEVVRVSLAERIITLRASLGRRGGALALNPQGTRLYALAPIEQQLVVLSAANLQELDRVDTGAHPTAVAVGGLEGDRWVYVAHRHSDMLAWPMADGSIIGPASPLPLLVGTPTDRAVFPTRMTRLIPNGAVALAVDPGDGTVSVAHVQATPGVVDDLVALAGGLVVDPSAPPPPPQYYGGADPPDTFNVPTRPVELMVTSYDGIGQGLVYGRPPVEHPTSGEPLTHRISDPRDIAYHPTHTMAFVVGEGSDSVLALNTLHGDPMVAPVAHIQVGAMPRAVAFSADGHHAYVLNGHDYTVSEIDVGPLLDAPHVGAKSALGVSLQGDSRSFEDPFAQDRQMHVVELGAVRAAVFGDDPSPAAVRRGRRLFHFARNPELSRDGHFSCATCHPGGGEDKLVWVVTHGPRQTPALAGRLAGTAPFNWNGTRHTLSANMERTIGRMGGEGLTQAEMEDVEAFLLQGLEADPNPHRSPDGLTYQQLWGKQLFESPAVGCATCHGGEATTNNGNFDVGTAVKPEVDAYKALAERGEVDDFDPKAFNVPSLRDLFATAPYLHTGSAATLMEVLAQTDGRMGNTGHLTYEEKEALVAYLLTL